VQETGPPGNEATEGPIETAGPADEQTNPPAEQTVEPLPADEQCTEEIQSNERWVCLTSATMDGDQLVINYDVEWAGSFPDITNGYHLHFYGSDGTNPPDYLMGDQAGDDAGVWVVKDEQPAILTPENLAEAVGDAPKVCARIANAEHGLVPDANGGYYTGNCVPIQR
jgi:molecular chaperone DnaK